MTRTTNNGDRPNDLRPCDPIYKLEMNRALLAKARRDNSPEVVIRGLEREIEWWASRAVSVCLA